MSALTQPRAELRGGNASDDSFAMSKSILTPFTALCTLTVDRQSPRSWGGIECAHSSSKFLGRGLAWVSYATSGAISREESKMEGR